MVLKKQTGQKTLKKEAPKKEKVEIKAVMRFKSGPVSATIFEQERQDENKKKFVDYSFSIQRAYTRDDGKTFEYTSFMRKKDAMHVQVVLNEVIRTLFLDEDGQEIKSEKENDVDEESEVDVDEEDI